MFTCPLVNHRSHHTNMSRQDWALVCCIIEIVVEVMIVLIYGIVCYRIWSKRKLHKSMDLRDKARSDLYLAQLRTQSAPNTPGFGGPMSPRFQSESKDPLSQAEEGGHTQFASKHNSTVVAAKPFTLQPPPIRVQHATPQATQDGFEAAPLPSPAHAPAAPGEQVYASVPIPGAYASPMTSPMAAPATMTHGAPAPASEAITPGQAVTSEHRIESPPASPRLPAATRH